MSILFLCLSDTDEDTEHSELPTLTREDRLPFTRLTQK